METQQASVRDFRGLDEATEKRLSSSSIHPAQQCPSSTWRIGPVVPILARTAPDFAQAGTSERLEVDTQAAWIVRARRVAA